MLFNVRKHSILPFTLFAVALSTPWAADAPIKDAVMWRDPTDLNSRNLFYGPGGKEHEPQAPFIS